MNLLNFAARMVDLKADLNRAEQRIIARSARAIQQKAKSAIGTYRFGWEPLAQSTIDRKAHGDTPLLETGQLRDSIGVTLGHREAWVGTNDEKAKWMEFGTSKAPARPFMGPAAIASHEKIEKIISAEMKHAVRGHGHGELWHALNEVVDLAKEGVEAGDEYMRGGRKE